MLPLGTGKNIWFLKTEPLAGNDLARALGWGGGYTGGNLFPFLHIVDRARSVVLDRWALEVAPVNPDKTIGEFAPLHVINNYWSIG